MPRTTAELLDELYDFIRIPSISSGDGEAADLRRAAEWVCARVRDAGGSAEVIETRKNPLAVGTLSCGRAGAPHLLVYGHYDVQTVAPLASWDSPPFEPEVRDGYIYARGASDDKGNFHCLLAALTDLRARGRAAVRRHGRVGRRGGDRRRLRRAPGSTSGAAATTRRSCSTAASWRRAGRCCTVGVRGVITGSLRVTTGVRDVHSGLYGGAGLNAAHVLATLIDGTRARDGLIPAALRAEVARRHPTRSPAGPRCRRASSELAAGGIAPLDADAAANYYYRTFALPTFDVNAITCRDATQQRTIIPYEATAAISLRLVPDQTVETVWAALIEHLTAWRRRAHHRARALGRLGGLRLRPVAAAAADCAPRA